MNVALNKFDESPSSRFKSGNTLLKSSIFIDPSINFVFKSSLLPKIPFIGSGNLFHASRLSCDSMTLFIKSVLSANISF